MSATLQASDRARAYVAKVPGAVSGAGGHAQTFSLACSLVSGFALSSSEARQLLGEYNARCVPPWSERELDHKIESAFSTPHDKPRGHLLGDHKMKHHQFEPSTPVKTKVTIDPSSAVENFLKGFRCTEEDLIARSPAPIPGILRGKNFHHQGPWLIDHLFHAGEMVNIVSTAIVDGDKARPGDGGVTLERNEWEKRLWDIQAHSFGGAWLRMNPLDGQGVSDVNVTAYRHALIEIDSVPLDLQLALLAKLRLPTAAILTSGGRSAHAWIRVDADDAADYKVTVSAMLDTLRKFGVDGKNRNPSRLSRLPGVVRGIGGSDGGQQRLLYLNPEPKQEALL